MPVSSSRLIWNFAPSSDARYLIVRNPSPVALNSGTVSPLPSSQISGRTLAGSMSSVTLIELACACLRALASAS